MKTLTKKLSIVLLIGILQGTALAQSTDVTPLFASKEPLEVKLGFAIKEVKKITNDTIYSPTVLHYKDASGKWDSIKIDLRARGEFRRKNCFFPPIRIKMKKKDVEGSLFTGNKSLKLVVPCQTAKSANDLIMREYLCYKLYEPITPYIFNTRMVNLTLSDLSGKTPKVYELKAFFIEDDGLVAKRFNAKMVKDTQLHPMRIQDTTSVRHDFFEYMISNTDWSSMAQHNIKVMQLPSKDYIPLAYDFDMAGLVNAPYAQVSELTGAESVRDRVYRGFCRTEGLFQHVRAEFIAKEANIMNALNAKEVDMNPKELEGARKYLGEFFNILKNDKSFKENILSKCRTK